MFCQYIIKAKNTWGETLKCFVVYSFDLFFSVFVIAVPAVHSSDAFADFFKLM